jgi:plastocyanin
MRPLLLAALALVLLPACGGDEVTPDEAAQTGGGAVVDVALTDFAIEPARIALDPGSYTFHVVNEGETVHALEVEGPSGEVETPELGPGESADLTVDLSEPGEYEVYCPVGDHRDQGMEGTITVGGGGGGTTTDETTTDETTTDEDSDYRY